MFDDIITQREARQEHIPFTPDINPRDRCIWKDVVLKDVYLHGQRGQMQQCQDCSGVDKKCRAYRSYREDETELDEALGDNFPVLR